MIRYVWSNDTSRMSFGLAVSSGGWGHVQHNRVAGFLAISAYNICVMLRHGKDDLLTILFLKVDDIFSRGFKDQFLILELAALAQDYPKKLFQKTQKTQITNGAEFGWHSGPSRSCADVKSFLQSDSNVTHLWVSRESDSKPAQNGMFADFYF